MRQIGFSTGSLHLSSLPLAEKLRLFKEAGATAVELSLSEQELLRFEPSPELTALLHSFRFVSVHAPDELHGSSLQHIVSKLKVLASHVHLSAITIHPDATTDFALLKKTGLPFAIENMDSKKQILTDARFFLSLAKYRLFAVLDLQHCYEHDSTMALAGKLADAMAGQLSHLHVSGQQGKNNHALLVEAENREAILTALKKLPQVPIILEGGLAEHPDIQTLREELACVRSLDHPGLLARPVRSVQDEAQNYDDQLQPHKISDLDAAGERR